MTENTVNNNTPLSPWKNVIGWSSGHGNGQVGPNHELQQV